MGTSDGHNGNAVFNSCSSLVSIDLRNINAIYDGTFTDCVNLVHLKNIKKNVLLGQANAGGEGPIYNLPKLTTKLYFTDARLTGTQEIRKAFFRQNGTTTIWLPNAAARLNASYVFYNSYNLKEIVIQKPTVMTISNSNALTNLAAGAKVYVPNDLVISYRKASYWANIYTRILPIIDGPSIIYGNGTYSFIPNTPFTGFTDIEWTLEENDYLSLTTEQDGSATIVASGMTSETDVTVRLEYSFNYDNNMVTGTINIPVAYQEVIQFEDEEVKRICVNNWGGIYGSAVKIPGVPGELTMEQAAAVDQLAEVFRGNTVITAFEELRFFTKIKAGGHSFRDCSNLRRVSINSTQWQFSYMVASGTTIRWNVIKMKNDGLSSSNWGTRGMGGNTVVLLRENKVYPLMASQQGTPKYYVPDNLVESYKTATNWTAYASRIYPLSEYTGEYPES